MITTAANELVGELHDRMPVILAPGACDAWPGHGGKFTERNFEFLG